MVLFEVVVGLSSTVDSPSVTAATDNFRRDCTTSRWCPDCDCGGGCRGDLMRPDDGGASMGRRASPAPIPEPSTATGW